MSVTLCGVTVTTSIGVFILFGAKSTKGKCAKKAGTTTGLTTGEVTTSLTTGRVIPGWTTVRVTDVVITGRVIALVTAGRAALGTGTTGELIADVITIGVVKVTTVVMLSLLLGVSLVEVCVPMCSLSSSDCANISPHKPQT